MGRERLLNRNIVHITMVGFALLIGRIPAWAIVLLCFLALVFNLFILPRLTKGSLEKEEDRERGFSIGLLTYPAILLVLSIVFYQHQVFLAIGWGMMAFGDGFASLIGRRYGKVFWYGGPKTLEGSMAFAVAATVFTWALLYALPDHVTAILPWPMWLMLIFIVAILSSITEMTPGFFDDNLSVPLIGSIFAYAGYLMIKDAVIIWPEPSWDGPLIVLIFGVLSYLSGAIDLKGSIAGMLIALLIWLGGGLPALFLLFSFFVLGSVAAFIGKRQKQETGQEAFRTTKRGWRNAVANGGTGALAGLLAWTLPGDENVSLVALAAAIASATSDTLSSELGTPFGKYFIDLRTMKRSVPGQDGVISITGTMLGLLGSFIIAGLAYFLLEECWIILIVGIAGFAGNLLDSVLGAGLQRSGFMNNHSVNLSSTLLAALFAALMFIYF